MTKATGFVPEGYRSVTPYLVARGVGHLLVFLREAFGAEELTRAEEPDGMVMHAAVKIGDSIVEMGDVGGAEHEPLLAGLHLYVRDVDATYAAAMRVGGKSSYAPKDMEYGDREGGIVDPSGNHWYVATHKSGKSYRPEGLRDLNPGFSVKDAAGFLMFLEKAYGAEVLERDANSDGVVGHAKVRIGDTVLELSEAHGEWGARTVAMHYYTENCDAVFAQGQAAGAKILLSMKDQEYGDRGGGLLDSWGNHWYIATHTEDLTLKEIQRRSAASSQS